MKKVSLNYGNMDEGANSKSNPEEPRKSKEDHAKEEPVEPSFKPWRVFINHVDSYHGKKLVDLLSDRVYVNPQGDDFGEEEEEEEEEEFDEEEEEEMEKEEKVKFHSLADASKKYEVIGTIFDPEHSAPEDVAMVVKDARNREDLLHELMKCGILIYDITQDHGQVEEARWALQSIIQELEKMEQISPKSFRRSNEVRYFVLISTLMTWANTKPLSPDEPELPFTEEDYRKRKPHPNFKEHIQCEKEVVVARKKVKLKDKLKTLVICCGATYGDEQGPLHHLFKMAWQNAPFLPIIGKGNNKIPLLHVRDLTNVVLDALQNWPPLRYIVATEQEPTSQTAIVKTKEIEDAAVAAEQGEPEQPDAEEEDDDEDVEEADTVKLEELQELLDEIERNMQRTNGRLDDSLLNKLFLRKLRAKEVSNQGYVMDGYPKTLEQARELFGGENLAGLDEEIDEEPETDTMDTIMPELVVSLEASDEFLKERIIQRPEREIQGTHYTEEHMMRRLREYRKRNTDDNAPLDFFDEIEIHPLIVNIEDDVCPTMFPTIYQCLQRIGPPRNYGLTAEEAKDARKRAEAEARAAETAARLREERELAERERLRDEKMAEWTSLLEKLKEEEEERFCLTGLPLRHYLMKYVFPTLTRGLIEVANLRPDDPVDYLAEYLFRENPEGKMFEPEHTEKMSAVLDAIEEFDSFIIPEEELGEQVLRFLKRDSRRTGETTEDSETEVCTSRAATTCVTPCHDHGDTDSYEREDETTSECTGDYDKED
ncbi:unnamed protein product [Xylocopa violacea]|uniref:Adenylate kinase 7 n=1 Tax=Xylocopa violacea TaxID=135666 RepID=A0ABP1NZJ3_XYLVO